MSVKGDARSEPPSSSTGAFSGWRSTPQLYAEVGFAGFIWLHLACQALRAHSEAAPPQPGFELRPAFVSAVLLLVWLPFSVFAWRKFRSDLPQSRQTTTSEQARALAILERLTLAIVLVFALLHGRAIVWPLLSGRFEPSDVRPELIASLSSTDYGVPLTAAGHLCAVFAAAFLSTRLALRASAEARAAPLARALVTLGVLSSLLGSYAVIRCASGAIFP